MVWNNLSDSDRVEFTDNGYRNPYVGMPITINDVSVGYVREINNDWLTGEQSYLITPTLHEDLKTSSNMAVIYRGSTPPTSLDGINDWLVNDIPMGANVIGNDTPFIGSVLNKWKKAKFFSRPTPQLISSSNTLNKWMKDYPQAYFDVYGHSLGNMDAAYAVAGSNFSNRIRAAYLYEGPNIYSILSKKQRVNLGKMNGRIFNFVDMNDIVALGYGYGAKGVGNVYFIDSKSMGLDKIKQHMWGGYQFDKNGNVILNSDESKINYYLDKLNVMAHILGENGLTKSEKIYLDAFEAKSMATTLSKIAESGIDDIIKGYKKTIAEFEPLWKMTIEVAEIIGKDLTFNEIMESLDQGGVNHQTVVEEPTRELEEKINNAKKVKQEYIDLANKIKQTVQKMTDRDQELKGMFKLG